MKTIPIDDVWVRYKDAPTTELRNQLIERYLPLVRLLARKMSFRVPPEAMELGDLISEGTLGLIEAIESFDLDRGLRFETFCSLRVRGAMLDSLRAGDWVPRIVRKKQAGLKRLVDEFWEKHGRPPRPDELRINGYSEPPQVGSLAKTIAQDPKRITVEDVLCDSRVPDPSERAQRRDMMRLLTRGLGKKERLVILLYYYEQASMAEIGQLIGIHESHVRQVHAAALSQLRYRLGNRAGELA